jgi:predicted component of type VI protein secretion system
MIEREKTGSPDGLDQMVDKEMTGLRRLSLEEQLRQARGQLDLIKDNIDQDSSSSARKDIIRIEYEITGLEKELKDLDSKKTTV